MVQEDENQGKTIPVRVAVRIRPLVNREIQEGCGECIDVTPNEPQVVFRNADKAFTFDYVFPTVASQTSVYESAVANVVKNLFQGYNVTVLAYGQTGSGKTHTMGTAYVQDESNDDEIGVIPRAVQDIFKGVEERTENEFLVKVSFIELYKENLYDLLGGKTREESSLDIREDPRGGIKLSGLTELPVTSLQETMQCLEMGALHRATGATAMNARSSRSHAIFSLHIEQRKATEGESIISAKFHMVDLAGSERAKKTGASGERLKEGININKGLLALGNVISALGDENHRGHVPYRDSKLTRLLQDSLGGNSHTVMVACVSPADSNFEETISTLRYADRARKIKNKPIVNRDPHAAELAKLRQQVQQLQVQLLATQGSGGGGEVSATSAEVRALLAQNQSLQEENDKLTRALHLAIDENTNTAEKALMAEMARDRLKIKLEELKAQTGNAVENLNKTLDVTVNPQFSEQLGLVKALQDKIMELQADQQNNEKAMMNHELSRHNISVNTTTFGNGPEGGVSSSDEQESDDGSPSKDFGTAFTLRQAKLNEELHELNRALTLKEELMVKMSANDDRFVSLRATYEKNVKDLEDQVNIVSKERDQLTQQLRSTLAPAASKISEQRRKRLKELEGQMQSLKKKITEQSKMLKMKEQTEKQVNKLGSEIQSMKAARVKLIRQMKEDNEKFRVWKAQKDREVAKLKQEDRKKQYQIVKMERLHTKQQNVLKRKMEEAVAINKRLKDAMALQKAGAERRAVSKGGDNMAIKVKSWLDGELEVVTVKKQAKHTLDMLIEDRKTISDQINKVKRQLNRGGHSLAMEDDLQVKRKNLENDMHLRTAQINDMQSKIMDGDQDNAETSKRRFESIQSMIEAKVAINYLFDFATTQQATVFTKESEFKDVQAHNEELMATLDEAESEMKAVKEAHSNELNKLSREYEDKTLFLLRQMPKTNGGMMDDEASESEKALLERLQFQEEEIARLSKIHEELQEKTEECKKLKKEITTAVLTKGNKVSLMPQLVSFEHKRPEKKSEEQSYTYVEDMSESEFDSENDLNDQNDPDWKNTPLYRKIRKITKGTKRDSSKESPISEDEDQENKKSNKTLFRGVKRDSSGEVKCRCKLNCGTKRCKCRSDGRSCGVGCKCNVLKCTNKAMPDTTFSEPSGGDTLLNSTFDVGSQPLKENNSNTEDSPTKKLRFSSEDPVGIEKWDAARIKQRIQGMERYSSPNIF
ncbi:kinesin-like protein 3A [Oratosquilla oratoria]|uniref:kinesin-like protein 3A n=1 Tax=Oratosquilla oratoria TaxID=337810 RepID=UPI003F764C95